MFLQYARLLAPNGVLALFCEARLAADLIAAAPRGWFRYEWIWDKTSCTNAGNAKRMPMRDHETILIFARERPSYFPQGLRCLKVKHRNTEATTEVYGGFNTASVQRFTGYPRSILRFPRGNELKPAEKPEALLDYLIRTYTVRGALVLDHVMGSGSTGVAAVTAGRRFYGIEIDPLRFRPARRRITLAASKSSK